MRIDPSQHVWMTAPETKAVMAALVEARFVGGAVRNALLGAGVSDVDIAVPMPPDETMARLAAAGIKTVPTGIDHGTVTAVVGNHAFEVTSLRRDVETDGRHAVIAFTDDWAEDAARRDFTINALYAGPDGEIFDYATGVEDLIAGRVRFMGDAATRIAEDYLRILRLFRFHAWYGRGEIDEPALRAAAAARGHLAGLSAERVAKEMLRLLEAPRPSPVVRVMAATGILSAVLPGALDLPRLERLCELDLENQLPPAAVLRLAALLSPADAESVGVRLKLSNTGRARLVEALENEDKIASHLKAPDVRRLLYKLGPATFKDRVRLHWAAAPRSQPALAWRMLLAMADAYERPRFPLTGRDVMAAGVPEGAGVGKVLAELESEWLESDFTLDEASLREKLVALAAWEKLMLRLVELLSLPGDPAKQNEDAFGGSDHAAVVLDGATMLGDGLMPGPSDAAWIAQFGARRLIAHLKDEEPKKALRLAMGDAERSFLALRRGEPEDQWQIPCASMVLVAEHEKGLEFLYLGDCGALVEQGDGLKVIGEALDRRGEESARAATLAREKNLPPAAALSRPEFLTHLRVRRNRLNSGDYWMFTPDKRAAAHAGRRIVAVEKGAHLLLASDGLLALVSDYGAYDAPGLLKAAKEKGLAALGEELRAIENADADGNKFARFKKSDDATALLLQVTD